MQIEVVDIRKSMGDGNLKAYADVKIDGSLVVKGFTVMNGRKGVFVGMPRKAGKDGRWFDTLKPLDSSLKKEIEDKVLEAYDRETDGVRSSR
jgi:stage V sporulation protein G